MVIDFSYKVFGNAFDFQIFAIVAAGLIIEPFNNAAGFAVCVVTVTAQ